MAEYGTQTSEPDMESTEKPGKRAAAKGKPENAGLSATLISRRDGLCTRFLPYPASGRYTFRMPGKDQDRDDLVLIPEGMLWKCAVSHSAYFSDAFGAAREQVIFPEDGTQLIYVCAAGETLLLFVTPENEKDRIFRNYAFLRPCSVLIGRNEDNDIICRGKVISRHHARVDYDGTRMTLTDLASANGTFVNGQAVSGTVPLQPGDTIYLMGATVICGTGFLSVNDVGGKAEVRSKNLLSAERGLTPSFYMEKHPVSETSFQRAPRRRLVREPEKIVIEGPPMPMNGNHMPLLLRMGSNMMMGASSLALGNYMMLGMMAFPMLTQGFSEKQRKEYETHREEGYRAYLEEKKQEIQKEKAEEEKYLRESEPSLAKLLQQTGSRHLWERRSQDEDFLHLRAGTGELPLQAEISSPKERFQLDPDVLEEEMRSLASTPVTLKKVPILVDLVENYVTAITGTAKESRLLARELILRAVHLFSPDELKIVFLMDEDELSRDQAIRFLPHVWSDDREVCFIATQDNEAYQISEYLRAAVGEDLTRQKDLKKILRSRPYYLVVDSSEHLLDRMEFLKEVLRQDRSVGISVLTVGKEPPKETMLMLRVNDREQGRAVSILHPEEEPALFSFDELPEKAAEESLRKIAATSLTASQTKGGSLPKSVPFLDLFGVGRVEYLNADRRWEESNPVKTLAAPVGVGEDGELFMLDLHQKFQGPHGLVAGMTGSGKSEFLITYILSMAICYHPYEVAFVLIDYKGGGLAGAFEDPARGIHLPHLVGTITNLDGAEIQRSLISLSSELMRRQRIFNEAKQKTGESTMDIYSYQRLYRSGAVSEPVPHLFIISDEFAELKAQQPEFMAELISTARIGRSLGVHLILATQKPSGVVNDQIRSNTKFQVCLKVQDRADSMDMLKRPDAAELKDTGRFYLQVGYNEYFALGQSAWSGADYYPQDTMPDNKDLSVQIVDHAGQSVMVLRPKKEQGEAQGNQLNAVVRYLSQLAKDLQIRPQSLWMPSLPDKLPLEIPEPAEEKTLMADIGVVDDPANQKQFPLLYRPEEGSLLIAGDAGSGKTVLLQTILLSLAAKYGPDDINTFLLDYSSQMLYRFRDLPHCAIAINERTETALPNTFAHLDQILQKRKELFRELDTDSFTVAREQTTLPAILVVIDNYAGFTASKIGSHIAGNFESRVREGGRYGIFYILTVSHLNEIPVRVRQEFPVRLALHLKDRFNYSDFLNVRCQYVPKERPGRGLAVFDGTPLEYQAYCFCPDETDSGRREQLKQTIRELAARWKDQAAAEKVPTLERGEAYETFAARFTDRELPLGYELTAVKPTALPLKQLGSLSLYFGNPKGIVPVTENLLGLFAAREDPVMILRAKEQSVFDTDSAAHVPAEVTQNAQFYDSTAEDLPRFIGDVVAAYGQRARTIGAFCLEKGVRSDRKDLNLIAYEYMQERQKPCFVWIERYADLQAAAGDDKELLTKLAQIFNVGKRYHVYFLGGFYPGEEEVVKAELYRYWNTQKMMLFFGGNMEIQRLAVAPSEYTMYYKKSAYDRFLMYYRDSWHALQMPCGELEEEQADPEELSIFGD